jgi:hypothetical protein
MKLDQLALDQPADQVRLPDELLAASAAFTAQPDLFPDLLDNFQSPFFHFFWFEFSSINQRSPIWPWKRKRNWQS